LNGEDCLIKRAHDCRADVVLEVVDPATMEMGGATVVPPPMIVLTIEQQVPVASTFLYDNSWVLRVSGAFVGGKYFIMESMDIHKHKVDILYRVMKAQFASLLNSHLLD
jgi:hypothetical protein